MVRGSGIRDKFIPNSLKELKRGRGTKRPRDQDEKPPEVKKTEREPDEDEDSRPSKAISTTNNLLSILPQPKNSSAFGPTVDLRKLLTRPESDESTDLKNDETSNEDEAAIVSEDGMIEVDISKVVGDSDQTYIKDLTLEQSRPTVVVPKGKEKQKNQITYLAQLGKATELERKEQAAVGRLNKAAARSKYGW